jgi:hypothetical protein
LDRYLDIGSQQAQGFHNAKALPALASLSPVLGFAEQVVMRRHHPMALALPNHLSHLMRERLWCCEHAMRIDAAHAKRAGASSLPARD